MPRFIFISFGLLGLAYYQLSGGANFTPSAPAPQMNPFLELAAAPQTSVGTHRPSGEPKARIASADQTPDALIEAALQPVPADGDTLHPDIARLIAAHDSAASTTKATPDAAQPVSASEQTAPRDLRRVSGTNVNLRAGPGTRFDVLTQLNQGDVVEVLRDPGAGWVKLRAEKAEFSGWMADFLLTTSS